ncbi:MAG: ShlB/FhaC/HecB family hemolysin secretion/activation protein [Polaromonas sp.]
MNLWFTPPPHLRQFELSPVVAGLALFLAGNIQAQTPAIRPDAGSTLQQQGAQPLAVPRAAPQVLPQTFTPQPALEALPSVSIAVKAITFSGNSAYSATELAPLVADLVGKTATLAELNAAAAKVRDYYRNKGYFLAQAYLPRQDVTSGSIEITVLEAYAGKVKATNKPPAPGLPATRLNESFAQGVLATNLKPGTAITEAALERPLLILSDLPGVDVKSALGAGASVGTADIEVDVANTPVPAEGSFLPLTRATQGLVTGSLDADNHGSTFTGAYRLGATVAVNNATGYGDQLLVRLQLAPENTRTNLARIAWQTPVGYYGTQVGVSYSKLNYLLIKDFAPLKAEGDATMTSVYATHPVVRSRNFNVSAQLNHDSKRLEDRLQSVNSTETRRINLTRVGLAGDWRDTLLGGGLNTFNLGLSSGRLSIDQAATAAADQALGGANTLGSFSKTNLDLLRLQTITDNINLLGSISAQYASRNLPSAEKMSLGGPNGGQAVRAYPAGEASGDEGYVGTFEARYTNPAWAIGSASTIVSAFYDFGGVTINKTPIAGLNNKRNLQGAGFGLTIGKEGDYTIRASVAWRIGNDKPQSDADRLPRVWVQGNKAF